MSNLPVSLAYGIRSPRSQTAVVANTLMVAGFADCDTDADRGPRFGTVGPWLSVSKPVNAEVLLLEGWVPDYVARAAVGEFWKHDYRYLCVTGGPLPKGFLAGERKTYAELAAESLLSFPLPGTNVLLAPMPMVYRGRTFAQAKGAKARLQDLRISPTGINVMTLGPHSRRSVTIFKRVFGQSTAVGVLSCTPAEYDADRWWTTSEGVRTVSGEFMAWNYEAIFGMD